MTEASAAPAPLADTQVKTALRRGRNKPENDFNVPANSKEMFLFTGTYCGDGFGSGRQGGRRHLPNEVFATVKGKWIHLENSEVFA